MKFHPWCFHKKLWLECRTILKLILRTKTFRDFFYQLEAFEPLRAKKIDNIHIKDHPNVYTYRKRKFFFNTFEFTIHIPGSLIYICIYFTHEYVLDHTAYCIDNSLHSLIRSIQGEILHKSYTHHTQQNILVYINISFNTMLLIAHVVILIYKTQFSSTTFQRCLVFDIASYKQNL